MLRGCGMALLAVLILGGGGWWYYRANDGLNRRMRGAPLDRQSAMLYGAIQSGDTESVERILTEQPKLLYARFGPDGTALHVAARYNQTLVIRRLIEWGADVADANGRFGATPLHW